MEQNIAETPFLLNAWAWIEKNRKQVIFGAVAVVVAVAVAGYTSWAAKEKRVAAGKELSRAAFSAEARQGGQTAAETLLKVAAANPGTDAGAQAILLAANELFQAGKHADAQAAFERFRKEYPGNKLTPQAIYGNGTALAAQGKWDEAVLAYKECVERHATASVAPYAKFALARAYESQGKSDLALPLYQDVLKDGENRSFMDQAAQRVEALLPKFTPPATGTATNAPAPQP